MDRRTWLLAAGAAASCSRAADPERLLPPVVDGVWKRGALSTAPAAPEQPAGTVRSWAATYTGDGAIHVGLYELSSAAGGLDATQRWKPAPDTVIFHHEQYFVTARWENVDRAKLTGFIRELEARVREGR
jgi:hypothetical protein